MATGERTILRATIGAFAATFLILGSATLAAQQPAASVGVAAKPYPIQSDQRKTLSRDYAKLHYGIDEWRLVDPEMIIVHFTGSDSDEASLTVFKSASLGDTRPDIVAGGALNVGIHYVVWRDGTLWSLMPETDMARHAAGFNHVALGIEMTGSSAAKLTEAQLVSCAALVADIVRRNPSVKYLCGHHEYVQKGRAHLALYRELMKDYPPPVKIDPGDAFMSQLRAVLNTRYSLSLSD